MSVCNSLLITRETEIARQFREHLRYTRALTRDVISVIILVQEREAIESYSLFGYAACAKKIANSFGHQKHNLHTPAISTRLDTEQENLETNHGWQNVGQSASEFKHNHNHGYCHPHNSAAQ